jgi:putative acetyltransferase
MTAVTVRLAEAADHPAIAAVTRAAFGRNEEASIVDRLCADGDAALELVAEVQGRVAGHVMFYLLPVRGRLAAVGLGPMSVAPEAQRRGIGRAMAARGLQHLQANGVAIVFVLGHPDYYPQLGFSPAAAEGFAAPWSGPAFMAVRLRHGPPLRGELIFPRAFSAAGG